MGTVVIEILSDDETEASVSSNPPADALQWASGLLLDDLGGFGEGLDDDSAMIQDFLSTLEAEKKKSAAATAANDDDDDCVILDRDPANAVFKEEKKPGAKDGPEEELQVLGEKGEVACRDFPHPRHLCAKLPFRTGSHANHCTMCHCYVCDSHAPCPSWGKGTLPSDHCHATDKDGKWSKLRQSLKRKSLAPSSQQSTGHQVSVPQPFTPMGTTVNQPAAGRVPVASNVSQNQQMRPSVIATQNVVRAVHRTKASTPAPKTSAKRSKRPVAAPAAYTPPNAYTLNRAIPNGVPWRPAPLHVLPIGQSAPGSNGLPGRNGQPGSNGLPGRNGQPGRNGLPGRNGAHGSNGVQGTDGAPGSNGAPGGAGGPGGTVNVIHGFPTQRSLAAPVQVRPTAHLQAAQNRVAHLQAAQNRASQLQAAQNRASQLQAAQRRAAATGLQSLQYATRTSQGIQRVQDPSAIQKSWQVALANLASDLGVSDYNINPPQPQQSASTQSLQHTQLLAQAKAGQGVETHRGNTLATAQMRSYNGLHQPNGKSGGSITAMPKTEATQALCVLNSHSSLTPSKT